MLNVEESVETKIKPNVNAKELLKDNKETTAHEISALLHQVCSKFSDYDCQVSEKLENALTEIKRLENVINNLNKKQCSKCVELVEITRALRKTLKEKDDTIAVVGKLLTNNPNKNSYALASQMVVDAIMRPAVDFTYFDSMYPEVELPSKENVEKTPEKIEIVNMEVSPVVLKRSRSNKRRFLSISSKKKNKTENCDTAVDNYTPFVDDYAEFAELSFLNIASGCLKTPENLSVMECITPLNSIHRVENTLEQSPEILNKTVEIGNDRLSPGKRCSNSDEKPKIRAEVRNSEIKFNRSSMEKMCADLGVNNLCKGSPQLGSELTNKGIIVPSDQPSIDLKSDAKKENHQFKALSTLNVNVLNNMNATSANSEHAKNIKATELEKQKPKTVWNLKKSRELTTNKKLKQTVLSTMVPEKKLDISTLKEYNGGSIPCSQIKKPERIVGDSMTGKDGDETFFVPLAASTNNNLHSEPTAQVIQEYKPATSPKDKASTELANKLKTPTKNGFLRFQDSFDYLPPKSPKYAYRRDAVRKRSERLKLPGQECDDCVQFYESRKNEMSDSQIRALLNKCSRHRDKYAIRFNTPPGLWNPVFDDTDEEIELK